MQTMTAAPLAPRLMEHRWGERIELDCPVRLELRDGTGVEGRLCNASISGAWIETGARLPARSLAYAIVNVIVPAGARRRAIELPACIARIAPDGVGVEWRDMAVPTLVGLLRELDHS